MTLRTNRTALALFTAPLALLAGCGGDDHDHDHEHAHSVVEHDLGLVDGLTAESIAMGLQNPSFVSFDGTGRLTISDSGHGRVLVRKADGTMETVVDGLPTEFWKVNLTEGTERFQLGALAALWLPDGRLAVSNGGLKDGEDHIVFRPKGGGELLASNGVAKTSDDDLDNGEGNLCGFSLSPDGGTLYVAGQGADAKTWVLACDVATRELTTLASADDAGIAINSPMHTMPIGDDRLLVLYSGAGGVDDGLFVEWDLTDGSVAAQWTLPGLTDPMGFAAMPDGGGYAVVDNNWALKEVLEGRIAKVTLPEGGGAAKVEIVADKVPGPVACAFGPDGKLYVALLGERFDEELGEVIAVSGL
ncbi:hypothetical protein Pla163_36040 [Planctomycetes bacterium Pla163]|uniref:Virginiamycin B lyase n=1 Tax=Rohdeia mirabilis TaxID=2528008 RepID=A0A518D4Q3_9BACT|nr:hypothetical protein Pla163_36040 [Planctomycetes bacterium Pla163]